MNSAIQRKPTGRGRTRWLAAALLAILPLTFLALPLRAADTPPAAPSKTPPADKPAAAPDDSADATPAAARAPVPSDDALRNANKLIRQLFGARIDGARTPAAKVDLARELLQQGIDTSGDPAGKFVLFRTARELAQTAGDPQVALEAVDETARAFRIDELELKQSTLAALGKPAFGPTQGKALADAAWGVLDEAIAADNFEIAKPISTLGLASARRAKDGDLVRQWLARGKELESLQTAFEQVKTALDTLDQKPADPDANLKVGRYRTLLKSDWDGGLPMLALSNDATLQPLAARELSPPIEPEDELKLADAWWDAGEKDEPAAKDPIQARAIVWYGKALPGLTGLAKSRVEKRLQDVTARIYPKIQAALRSKHVVRTPPAGIDRGSVFLEMPDEGALLIGLEIAVAQARGGQFVRSIRPVFLTAHGEVSGNSYGGRADKSDDVVKVKAKDGFAVAGLTVATNKRICGMSVLFMQIQGTALNSRNSYTSDWIGDRINGTETRLGGSGAPVVGITGKADNSLEALVLMLTR